ncbi:MAG: tetraacyldisaccharide 4'-kinase [Alphaproteobacteria bacterium]|jgi:tetraacyldisaccharide 4'-kinase|nr:tetraacyldisaccharide 4'-kinase [Alphaproteobacteria bacterium]
MRAPEFWDRGGLVPALLAPAAELYRVVGRFRQARTVPWRAPIPVVCVGNLVAGGAGKTPVALSVGARLGERGRTVHFLTRGYGGRRKGPLRVDARRHDANSVGDEALLLAAAAPTWVARDRAAGAKAAAAAGGGVIVMDDGFQNPGLAKDLSLVVVDGAVGFGNERLIPAGPLREPIAAALARADAIVVLGADRAGIGARFSDRLPVLFARLVPGPGAESVRGRAVVAFAGIGRPEKFFATLESLHCEVLARHPFADHHRYRDHEVMVLADKAVKLGAILVTTAKDAVRIPEPARPLASVLDVTVAWDAPGPIDDLLARLDADG